MDIKKVLALIESAEQKKETLTEGKNMAKDMVMQHYTKQEIKTPIKKPVSRINEYFKVVDNEMLNVIKEEQDAKRVEVKRIVNRVLERLDEGKKVEAPKPRNFVAKNAKTAGAGAHKDKKKAEKQGEVKHKKQAMPLDEKAPPGEKAERMVKHIKKGYAKDGKLTDKEKSIAYATAWKQHNKKTDEGVAGPEKCWPGHRKVGTKPGTGKNAGKRVNDCEKIGETIEVGSPVRVYSNVLKKPVYGVVIELRENRAYINYLNTKIVMGHPITKVQLSEAAAAAVAPAAAGIGSKLAKFIPGVGLVAGGYDAYKRAQAGDYTGAALSAGAGIAGMLPGLGTAAALGLAGAQMGRDKARTGSFIPGYDEIGKAAQAGQAPTPAPQPNKKGTGVASPVTQMQSELQKAGATITVDGKMGPQTRAAMAKFPDIAKKYQGKIPTAAPAAKPAPAGSDPTAPDPKWVSTIQSIQKATGKTEDEVRSLVGDLRSQNNSITPDQVAKQLSAPTTATINQAPAAASGAGTTKTTNTRTSVSGTIKMGKPEGPIEYNGKTVNPGDPEYTAASQALMAQQGRIQQARQNMRPGANRPAPVGGVTQGASQELDRDF